MADLVTHTASIHARTTAICETLPEERIPAPQIPTGADPVAWYEGQLEEMVEALRDADPNTPVWTFTTGGTIAFWVRRMLIETGVHRWDAQQALEDPDDLPEEVSEAGLDEFESMWLPRLPELPTLEVVAIDLGRSWVYGPGRGERVEDEASRLYLRLMSRPGARLPQVWEKAVDGLGGPAKG